MGGHALEDVFMPKLYNVVQHGTVTCLKSRQAFFAPSVARCTTACSWSNSLSLRPVIFALFTNCDGCGTPQQQRLSTKDFSYTVARSTR